MFGGFNFAPGRRWLRFPGQDDLCPALAQKLRLRGAFGASAARNIFGLPHLWWSSPALELLK